MASRPLFVPDGRTGSMVRELTVEFRWSPGLALVQKRRSITSLHEAAAEHGISPVLEISTASLSEFGRHLSAFNLKLSLEGVGATVVESVFQGSKVFEHGGPYQDLYAAAGRDARRDGRLRSSGSLVSFSLSDSTWTLIPRTAFYDWLYLNGLKQLGADAEGLLAYAGFTDIEFNPVRSLNCQARSAALYVALRRRERLDVALSSAEAFLRECAYSEASQKNTQLGFVVD